MDRSLPAKGAQRWVPLAYLGLAHLALGAAAAVTLWDSSLIWGFFYHPKMIAVVHALTLGWISSSLIGMLYAAAPRLGFRATRFDVWVLVTWATGCSGLISHFWIEEFGGMTWSAGLAGIAILLAAGRFGAATARASLPAHVKLMIQLAWLNLTVAAFIGVLLGINKTTPVLPGYSLDNVFAHAHLAAIGWVFLLGVAVGHLYWAADRPRGLPLVSIAGTILTQLGAVGVFVTLLTGSDFWTLFGLTSLLGIPLCMGAAAWPFRPARLRPAHLSIAAAAVWLGIAVWILLTTYDPKTGTHPDAIMAYGVAGLLGGLGQGVAGLVLLGSRRIFAVSGNGWPAVVGWLIAPPLLLRGLETTRPQWIFFGTAALLFAVLWTSRWIVAAVRVRGVEIDS